MNLLECGHNGIGMVTCDRSHEAGVRCKGKLCNVLCINAWCTCSTRITVLGFCTAFPNKNSHVGCFLKLFSSNDFRPKSILYSRRMN